MQSYSLTNSRKQNPREKTLPLCAALYLHMIPIFWKFKNSDVSKQNLYEALREHKSSKLGGELEVLWNKIKLRNGKKDLHFALFLQFKWELLLAIFLFVSYQIVMVTCLPIGVGGIVLYFQEKDGNIIEAYYSAGILLFGILVRSFGSNHTLMMMNHICMKMRIACCSLIYRKTLRLSVSALSQTTVGQIVNLLSNDVGKFDQTLYSCPNIFSAPLATSVAIYQLYVTIGLSTLFGMTLLLLMIPLQMYLGKLNSKARFKTSTRTDERLRLTNEILTGINVIKMYTWEPFFSKMVSTIRRYEIKAIRYNLYIETIRRAAEIFMTRTATFITIVGFVFLGNNISAKTAFAVTATYGAIRVPIAILLPQAITGLSDTNISLNRIQRFLRLEELTILPESKKNDDKNGLVKNQCDEKTETNEEQVLNSPKVVLNKVNVKRNIELPIYTLENIDLNVHDNQLVALIGPVGSGKSSLFEVILRELPIIEGTLDICGTISFASQEPWLFAASVRQNILFGNHYDADRYNTVINVCALKKDFEELPYGDHTIIIEGGKSLSGGQKARINLARCVYREADIYLLDDPLSAVDAAVGKHLFEFCIKHFLRDKICMLVTHQLQYLKSSDKIVILKGGEVVGHGTYDELQNTGLDFAALLKEFYPGDDQELVVLQATDSKAVCDTKDQKTNSIKQLSEKQEAVASGNIDFETYAQYFQAGGGYFLLFVLCLAFIVTYLMAYYGDYFVAHWVTLEQSVTKLNGSITDTYVNSTITRKSIIYIYSGITALTILMALGLYLFYFITTTRASANLHSSIFEKVIYATMPFFDCNPTGRILNRFSKDIGIVDDYVPIILANVIQVCLGLGVSILLSAIINIWSLLPFAVLFVSVYYCKLFYINTSKGAKRIEGITRSPIMNHITESLTGRSTIRACGVQNKLLEEFDSIQDLHSSAWYLFISAARAFGLWIDIFNIVFIVFTVLYFLLVNQAYSGGEIGFLITNYLFMNNLLSFGVQHITDFQNNMVSVERVLEYTKAETEPKKDPTSKLPVNWPEQGMLIFSNLSLKYTPKGPNALKNINLTVCPGEKVGTVGRTGAGKSSLIAAIFQMYYTEGNIIIDGIDVTKIPLIDLRSRISIIPQQPVLFSGSLRMNLDPLEQFTDNHLWHALEQVELKDLIETLPGGLSIKIQSGGSNFSIGQKQLICFARAIVNKNKILIMDEATANVDPYTDAIIQRTVRDVFCDCTIITIAHRLHTIIDCDKVMVVHNGSVVEFDHPYSLFQTQYGSFYEMAQAAGNDTFNKLFAIAEETFKKKS